MLFPECAKQNVLSCPVQPQALSRVLFPVGGMCKGEVRQVATERGLLPADRRSSAGICFIGESVGWAGGWLGRWGTQSCCRQAGRATQA